MKIRQMQGVSAYIEYVVPYGQKSKRKCIFYENNICRNFKIQHYLCRCVGWRYCISYTNNKNTHHAEQVQADVNTEKERSIPKRNYKRYISEKEKFLNKKIKLLNIEENEFIVITIVEEQNKDLFNDKISIEWPLGKAIRSADIGKIFEVVTKDNIARYILISIH